MIKIKNISRTIIKYLKKTNQITFQKRNFQMNKLKLKSFTFPTTNFKGVEKEIITKGDEKTYPKKGQKVIVVRKYK
jgi:spore coat protein CotF